MCRYCKLFNLDVSNLSIKCFYVSWHSILRCGYQHLHLSPSTVNYFQLFKHVGRSSWSPTDLCKFHSSPSHVIDGWHWHSKPKERHRQLPWIHIWLLMYMYTVQRGYVTTSLLFHSNMLTDWLAAHRASSWMRSAMERLSITSCSSSAGRIRGLEHRGLTWSGGGISWTRHNSL